MKPTHTRQHRSTSELAPTDKVDLGSWSPALYTAMEGHNRVLVHIAYLLLNYTERAVRLPHIDVRKEKEPR